MPVLLLLAVVAFAQPAPNSPAFEVASIKPSPPAGHLGYLTYPGGRVNFGHCTLEMLITYAFDIQKFQISGGPDWIRTERYEIDARVPANSESSKANPSMTNAPMTSEQRAMLAT
ncbi:MAG TPA: TIGR03435 family protein, partial [Bryobacteraceae bacterium]